MASYPNWMYDPGKSFLNLIIHMMIGFALICSVALAVELYNYKTTTPEEKKAKLVAEEQRQVDRVKKELEMYEQQLKKAQEMQP